MYTQLAQSIGALQGTVDPGLLEVLRQLGNCMAELMTRNTAVFQVDPMEMAYPNNPNSGAPGVPDYQVFGGDQFLGVQFNQNNANFLNFAAVHIINMGGDIQVPAGDIFDDQLNIKVVNGQAMHVVGPIVFMPNQINDPLVPFDPALNAPGDFGNRICFIVNGAAIANEMAVQDLHDVQSFNGFTMATGQPPIDPTGLPGYDGGASRQYLIVESGTWKLITPGAC